MVISTTESTSIYNPFKFDKIKTIESKSDKPNFKVIGADISRCGRIFVTSMSDRLSIRDTTSW
jgi:hypothetical protein